MLGTLSIYAAERAEKRWILGALGIAILLHAILFSAFGFYHLRGMEIPANHSDATGPFTVKQVEISADAFKPDQPDPTTKLPQPEPPKNPAEFNLDPSAVQKSLQTPLPKLSAPAVPEPDRVIASVDLGHDMPYVESDSAKITAEINHTDPSTAQASPVSTSQLAQEVISSSGGLPHPGVTPGVNIQGDGAANKVPGFGDLASGFRPADSALSKLPEPVLLRLPADVLFDFDSADLKSQADPLLAQAVTMINQVSRRRHPDRRLQRLLRQARLRPETLGAARGGGAGLDAGSRAELGLQFPLAGPRQHQLHRANQRQHRTAAAQPPRRDFDSGSENAIASWLPLCLR